MEAYLGDGVYVKLEGGNFLLYTSNGIEVSNEIWLYPEVFDKLQSFAAKCQQNAVNNFRSSVYCTCFFPSEDCKCSEVNTIDRLCGRGPNDSAN